MENETKLCKHCQTEIPKKAKVCPNCRKKQGGIGKWIAIAVVVVIILCAAASGGKDEDKPKQISSASSDNNVSNETVNSETESQDEVEKDTFGIGETAELNDVQVTMTSYEESNGSEYNNPADGNVFVLVEFEIANNSDSEIAISSMMSFDAYSDDYALNYSLSALMEKDGATQLDGTIASGKKMKGIIGYEVPEDWSNIEIHFTDNVWSNNKFKFLIEK